MAPPKKLKKKCVLCSAVLTTAGYPGFWLHPVVETCGVRVADDLGLSVDERYGVDAEGIFALEAPPEPSLSDAFGETVFTKGDRVVGVQPSPEGVQAFFSTETAVRQLFESMGLEYLGGASGQLGWSSVGTFQRCRYLWRHKYGGHAVTGDAPGPEALEIGSLLHIFLAVHYMLRVDPAYPLTPEMALRYLQLAAPVTPDFLAKAWALYDGYRMWWGDEAWMEVLAVEELAVDPRTGFSCRWDLVFRVKEPLEGMFPGVYICNHKSAADNGMVTREQWKNDGQILGEINLYNDLGYHRRWGALRGNCINLVIKTQNPQYVRSWVYPIKPILKDHHKSLQIWSAEMQVAKATGSFPRSRAQCVTRYRSFCELFEHCAGGDAEREIEI